MAENRCNCFLAREIYISINIQLSVDCQNVKKSYSQYPKLLHVWLFRTII